ncbi:MAG TPA: ADOP family duplicated permease [Longimicrobiales bacterium]|nr:ADOP family duplicated permease [Longimicrobiales bacterium]
MRPMLRLGSVERDVSEELAFHFAEAVDDLVRRGWTRPAAESEVHRRFGDETRYRRELLNLNRSRERRMRWSGRLGAAGEAVREAVRGLTRTPGMTIGIVVVFALGVGANATILQIIDRLMLRPPDHVVAADDVNRVVIDRLDEPRGERSQTEYMTYPDYRDLHGAKSFSAVAGYAPRELTIGHGESAHLARTVLATGDYFDLIGVRPHVGRFFTDEESRLGGERVAVVGYGYWQRQLGGASDVLGRTVQLAGNPYTIIGVAPQGLTTIDLTPAELWFPLEVAQGDLAPEGWADSRNWWWMRTLVRRAEGVTPAQAGAEATALHVAGRESQIAEGNYGADTRIEAYPLVVAERPGVGSEPAVARWLAGVALVVLLIACINVANLLFARMLRRQREIGIQLALGVGRGRLVGRILLEGALLGLLGGAAALAVAWWGGGALRRLLLPDVAWSDLGLSTTVLLATGALALLAGVLSAVVPALQAARRDVVDVLRTSAGGITRSALRVRTALSFAQAALSVLLLIGAGLFVRSMANAGGVDHGYEPEGLLYANMSTPRNAIPPAEQLRLERQILERVGQLPGVESAAFTSSMPFWSYLVYGIRIDGVDSLRSLPTGGAHVHVVSPGYLETTRMDVVRGRGLGDGSAYAAVVNETMAREIGSYGDPIGRCIYMSVSGEETPCIEIAGVVEDATAAEFDEDPYMQYYVTLPAGAEVAEQFAGATLMLRAAGNEAAVMAAVRREILALDNRISFVDIHPFAERMEPLTRSWQLGATLFTAFGLLALLVAAVGLYSVLAFDVAQRTRELGLRTALGAQHSRLLAMIVGRGIRVTMAGIAAGLLVAVLLAGRIEPLLFHVSGRDTLTYAVVAGVLLLVAAFASWLPAMRAARVRPMEALKAE